MCICNFSHANNISIQMHKNVYRGAMFYGIYFLIYTYKNTHVYTVTIQENYCQCANCYSGSILMKNGYFFCDYPKSELLMMYACHGYDTHL